MARFLWFVVAMACSERADQWLELGHEDKEEEWAELEGRTLAQYLRTFPELTEEDRRNIARGALPC